MTGWHTLALSLGEAAHQAYVEEAKRNTSSANFLRKKMRRSQFATPELRRKLDLAYCNYRVEICRRLRHNDIRKGGV